MRNVIVFMFITCTAAACSPPPPAPQPAAPAAKTAAGTYQVRLNFDGGYAFIHRTMNAQDPKDDTLTVAALMDKSPHSGDPHAMRLQVNRGDVKAGQGLGDWDASLQTWLFSKNNYDLKVMGLSGGIQVPTASAVYDCTKTVPDNQANNLALLPNISQIAYDIGSKATLKTDRAEFGNQVLLEGGTLVLRKVASCFEYAVKNEPKHQQFFTDGRGSLTLEVQFDAATPFKIGVQQSGGAMDYIEIAPVSQNIELSFGRPCTSADCKILTMNQELKDFQRFFEHFTDSDTFKGKWPKPKKKAGLSDRFARIMTPGDECPPGWYEEPLLSRASQAAATPAAKSGGSN